MSEMQKSYRVVNPYNFIPFEAEPDRQPQGSWYPDPKKLLSGWLDVDIRLKTPLIIPTSGPIRTEIVEKQPETNENKKTHNTYGIYHLDGKPAIPGSSLRGMLRSLYEAASNSCLPFLLADDHPISQRTPLYAAFHRRGLLEYDMAKNTWSLWRARAVRNQVLGSDVEDALYKQDGKAYKNAQRVAFTRVKDADGFERFHIEPDGSKDSDVEYGYLQFSIPVVKSNKYYVAILTKTGDAPIHQWKPGDSSPWDSLNGSVYDTCKNTGNLEDDESTPYNKPKKITPTTQRALRLAMRAVEKQGGMIPVYFFEVERNGEKLYYFSGAAAGRVQQRRKWPEIMGPYSPCDGKNLCPACALFGTASGTGLKGKLRFTDASPLRKLHEQEHTLSILSGPRPSAFEFYLRKPEDPQGREITYWNFDYFGFRTQKQVKYTDKDGVEKEKTLERTEYDDLPEATPRGRKMYWHSQPAPDSREKSDQNSTMTAVFPADPRDGLADFRSRIYFDRITEAQLRDIIWIVTLGENDPDSTRCQKLGHAKPLGYGSVKLTVADCQIRHLDHNLEMRLEPRPVPAFPDSGFDLNSRSMQALLKMCDMKTTENLWVEYPYGLDKKGTRTIYQWFAINRTNPKGLVTLSEPTDPELTLESNRQRVSRAPEKKSSDFRASRSKQSSPGPRQNNASREWNIRVGDIVEASVLRIDRFGFTVQIPGVWEYGFVHIREIANRFVDVIEDYVMVGDNVRVKYLGQDYGKRQFSLKQAQC